MDKKNYKIKIKLHCTNFFSKKVVFSLFKKNGKMRFFSQHIFQSLKECDRVYMQISKRACVRCT